MPTINIAIYIPDVDIPLFMDYKKEISDEVRGYVKERIKKLQE